MLFHILPKELIHTILSWEGSMKLRNGKWMDPLQIPDETRELLQTLLEKRFNSYKRLIWGVVLHTIKIPTSPDIGKQITFFIFNNHIITYQFSQRDLGYGDRDILASYDYWTGEIELEEEDEIEEEPI